MLTTCAFVLLQTHRLLSSGSLQDPIPMPIFLMRLKLSASRSKALLWGFTRGGGGGVGVQQRAARRPGLDSRGPYTGG